MIAIVNEFFSQIIKDSRVHYMHLVHAISISFDNKTKISHVDRTREFPHATERDLLPRVAGVNIVLNAWCRNSTQLSEHHYSLDMQMLPLRNFSFDLTSKKTSSEGERGRDRSNERRDRWRRIRIFSQGPLRVTPRPSPATTQNTRSSNSPSPAMSDFFSRESELLGEGQLPPATASTVGVEDIDLDLAASAFPDISLDGSGDIPTPVPVPISTEKVAGSFSFDSFPEPTRATTTEVKITGNDEIERFEDQFPDIGASSSVCPHLLDG